MKKYLCLLLGMLIILLLSCASNSKVRTKSLSFKDYADSLFDDFLGIDPINVCFTLYNQEEYLKYANDTSLTYDYLLDVKDCLNSYSDSSLSYSEVIDKMVINDYINRYLRYEGLENYRNNLGSYLGYQAQIPLILAEYRFDSKRDIDNYLLYVNSLKKNFIEIIEAEKKAIFLGMGISDQNIQMVIEQCDNFLMNNECFLIDVINNKIEKCEFLSEFEIMHYKRTNTLFVNVFFMDAYRYLREELINMRGLGKEGSMAQFEGGKKYYEALIFENVGTDMSIPMIKNYLDEKINEYKALYLMTYFSAQEKKDFDIYKSLKGRLMSKDNLTLDSLIPFFRNVIKDDFPPLDANINISITEIDKSMQNNSSPAMYFLSPIDGNKDESIYINPLQFNECNDYMYQTIAHEGFPGHLYQHVYMKNSSLPRVRKILSFKGYAEGWATYVENYVVKYQLESYNENVLKFYEADNALIYLCLGRADIGINYDNWSIGEVYNYLNKHFIISMEDAYDIYYTLIEIPTNYLQYYLSYHLLLDIKKNFRKMLGNEYSDMLFHTIFLNTGPCSFQVLEKVYNDYAKTHQKIV